MDENKPKMKFIYFLPLGSIVLLKGGKHKLMITGHNITTDKELLKEGQIFSTDGKKPKVYNYMGVLWPEGDALVDRFALFNQNDIDKVIFKGFLDEEVQDYHDKVDEVIKDINNNS